MQIDVHEFTNDPTAAWREISKSQRVIKITMKTPNPEIPKNKVRVVCMSDTHSLTPHIKFEIPDGDIFIHAGDFTKCGRKEEVIEFNTWIGKNINNVNINCFIKFLFFSLFPGQLPHKHKLVIAGNHELSFDHTFTHPFQNITSTSDRDRRLHTGKH